MIILRSHSKAFTLLELLVTIAVVAIVTAVAAPSFTNIVERQRVSGVSYALRSSIEFARSEAIKRNTVISVSRVGDSWNNGWQVAEGATILESSPAHTAVNISSAVTSLQFDGSGRAGTASTFGIKASSGNSDSTFCLRTNLNGQVRGNKGSC